MNHFYHATYKPYISSIRKHGLCAGKNKSWEDSRKVVYLATSAEIAESYAETAEIIDENEDLFDEIVILKIDITKLDQKLIQQDKNVLKDDMKSEETFEYHGVIPVSCINIYDMKTFKEIPLLKEAKSLKIK